MSWLRGTSFRARLTRTLTGLGLVSVLLLATVNLFVVRELLSRSAEDQLVALREVRTDQFESGFDSLLQRVSALGADPALAAALQALDSGYRAVEGEPADDALAGLEAAYESATARYREAGVDVPSFDALVPSSAAGRYVQAQYVSDLDLADRRALADAGDGSAYSRAHAEFHPFLLELSESFLGLDLLLVSGESGEIIYSVDKRIDLGTDVESGPYATTGVGTVWERLGVTGVGDAVASDSGFYLPAGGAPTLHAGTIVRAGTEVVGAVMIALPISVLTDIVSSDGRWELLGLGETGDAYLVGADRRLRTVPRSWIEDPDGSLRRFREISDDDLAADLIEYGGSPVLLASVDNAAVDAALDGERFLGTVDNQLDRRAVTASGPVALPGLDWVIVTEQGVGESRRELLRFVLTIGIVLAVLLPVLALVGTMLARMFARPVEPLVSAADRIADGDFDSEVPELGRNELGDLGRQLVAVAAQLRDQDATIEREEQRISEMLESVMPAELVEPIRRGELGVGDVVDSGTVVALDVRGLPVAGAETEIVFDITERLGDEARALAVRHGVEQIRVAADQQLFVAGRGSRSSGAADAVDFAADAVDIVAAIGAEYGVSLTAHAGLAAGTVATGVLGSRQMSFGVWGDCVGRAMESSARAAAGEIVVDDRVVADHPDASRFALRDDSGEGAESVVRFVLRRDEST